DWNITSAEMVKVGIQAWDRYSQRAVALVDDLEKVAASVAKVTADLQKQGDSMAQSLESSGELADSLRKIESDFTAAIESIGATMGTLEEPTQEMLDAIELAFRNKSLAIQLLWKSFTTTASADAAADMKVFTDAVGTGFDALAQKVRLLPPVIGASTTAVDAFIAGLLKIPEATRGLNLVIANFGATTDEALRNTIALKETNQLWTELAAKTDEVSQAEARRIAQAAKVQGLTQAWTSATTAVQDLNKQLLTETSTLGLTGEAFARAALEVKLFGDQFDPLDAKMVTAVDRALALQKQLDALIPQKFARDLQDVSVRAQVLGTDFDQLGAIAGVAQSNFERTMTAFKNGTATIDDVTAASTRLQDAWANQRLFTGIKDAFLSVTDAFSKMAEGIIQGTLDIATAFKNLGQNLIISFV
ncbi:MAG: hypothetical protein L0219_02950, partial [Phycisphaerales bacterium]|nr:hypothetical protein [Phycisphaerales bacterium]